MLSNGRHRLDFLTRDDSQADVLEASRAVSDWCRDYVGGRLQDLKAELEGKVIALAERMVTERLDKQRRQFETELAELRRNFDKRLAELRAAVHRAETGAVELRKLLGSLPAPQVSVNVPEQPAPVVNVSVPAMRKEIAYDQHGRPVEIRERPIA